MRENLTPGGNPLWMVVSADKFRLGFGKCRDETKETDLLTASQTRLVAYRILANVEEAAGEEAKRSLAQRLNLEWDSRSRAGAR
jgi:hypothetical protein